MESLECLPVFLQLISFFCILSTFLQMFLSSGLPPTFSDVLNVFNLPPSPTVSLFYAFLKQYLLNAHQQTSSFQLMIRMQKLRPSSVFNNFFKMEILILY